MHVKTMYQKAKETMQAQLLIRVGALLVSLIVVGLSTGWMGAATASRTFAEKKAMQLVKPALDPIRAKQAITDSNVAAIADTMRYVKETVEIIFAAQRQSSPGFDRALQDMARAGDLARKKKQSNMDLLHRIRTSTP